MFTSLLFIISSICFFGVVYNLLALKKPGMYPPKQILRKRAGSLAGGGALFLLFGIIFLLIQ
ncbi:MAG TPA: hypothetical protein DCR24_00805 [Bacillus bacterium]|nr:hypothetical protein [Bacillus sp. (in: firmicutes)]